MNEPAAGGEPLAERAGDPAAPSSLKPIGGWLLLPTFGLVISLLTGLMNLAALLLRANGRGAAARQDAAWRTYVTFDIVALAAYLPFLFVVTFLFFRRDKATPILMILTYAVALIIRVVERLLAVRAGVVVPGSRYASPNALLLVSIGVGLVWCAYFLFSKRVKDTFVN